MCGIIAYLGFRDACSLILSSLRRLEYRGYDSCGIGILSMGKIHVYKSLGGVENLGNPSLPEARIGLGHTRWATHGEPSIRNAHPHLDCTGKIAVVHNGIIRNHEQLRDELEARGHEFKSETDTEVIPHLIEENYSGSIDQAFSKALLKLRGSYAIAMIHSDHPALLGARNQCPLILGLGDGEYFLSSDVPAFLEYTNRAIYLEDGEWIRIGFDGYCIFDRNQNKILRPAEIIPWSITDAERAGYEHFMLKEIHEIPRAISDTLADINIPELEIPDQVILVGCGSSYHAALIGEYLFENISNIPARAYLASEFNYSQIPLSTRSLVIGITQSGETADTLLSISKARKLGAPCLAITNTLGSSITRIAQYSIFTRAGPEICVASTKTFSAQLSVIYALALDFCIPKLPWHHSLRSQLELIPSKINLLLDSEEDFQEYAKFLAKYKNAFCIGRGIDFPVALEGALKLKEICYIHAEAYAAGELKHGPFALLDKDFPVIAIVTQDNAYEPMLNNIKEIKSRGSPVICICSERHSQLEDLADFTLKIPEIPWMLSPMITSVALQLLAYYTARELGREIDKPRHLAKSVTVE